MNLRGKIIKAEDKFLVFGIASAAGVVDAQGDTISIDELERAVYDYNLRSRAGSEMHNGERVADLVESFFITKEKAAIFGISDEHIGKWFVGFKVSSPEVWQAIKNGKYTGFSIGGSGRRE